MKLKFSEVKYEGGVGNHWFHFAYFLVLFYISFSLCEDRKTQTEIQSRSHTFNLRASGNVPTSPQLRPPVSQCLAWEEVSEFTLQMAPPAPSWAHVSAWNLPSHRWFLGIFMNVLKIMLRTVLRQHRVHPYSVCCVPCTDPWLLYNVDHTDSQREEAGSAEGPCSVVLTLLSMNFTSQTRLPQTGNVWAFRRI